MFDPEAPSPDFVTVNQDLIMFSDLLSDHYGLRNLSKDSAKVSIGEPTADCIERVVDRAPSIQRTNGDYTFNAEDFQIFEDELDYVLPPEMGDAEEVARKLFVGLGVAGTALQEIMGKNPVSVLKEESHAKQMYEFFASHDAINQTFVEIFDDPGFKERAEMTKDLDDERAIAINGLRLSFALLYSIQGMGNVIGVEQEDLKQSSRTQISYAYERDINYYMNPVVIGLNQNPKVADRMFFNSLPTWIIAAAAPMQLKSFSHLLSRGWQRD